MKVLIVGGGGREHALAWKLRRDDPTLEIVAAPGNPGIATIARCLPVSADDIRALATLAEDEEVDFTIVGPEGPLDAGIVNLFRSRGLHIFGPTREAARIESSKRFAKELMLRAGVPTARATHFSDAKEAKRGLAEFSAPVVVKASGLAAGKGVVVAQSAAEAERAIDAMLGDRIFGAAGREILIEEFMDGEEISLFAVCDGEAAVPLLAAQDHKRLLDGDNGPNTGGMGAYAPASIATSALVARAITEVIQPVLAALRGEGAPFTGLLYAGLMINEGAPRVVEFNCRFGDPETQALLPLMKSSLLDLLSLVARGESVAAAPAPEWLPLASVTTVLAASGYPEKARTGDRIHLPPPRPGVEVFHAGTSRSDTGDLVTAGGRVLSVTATAPTLEEAAARSRAHAEQIVFSGRQLRRDIAWRELARHAGAS